MKYMIHACPKRMWYVSDYLIPSMLAQGIDKGNIIVWNDIDGVGNLASCLASFASCQEEGETWHLQDDVVICHDFAERTASAPKGWSADSASEDMRMPLLKAKHIPNICGSLLSSALRFRTISQWSLLSG